MGLVRPLRHVTALCGACLQSSLPRTKTVTWRNPTFASAADPHVCTQQRPGHLSSLTRVVTSQSLRVVKRHRGTIWNLLRPARGSSHPFQGDSDNFAKISLHYSVHFTPAPFKPLPPPTPSKKNKFPNTYAPWPPLPSVWQPGWMERVTAAHVHAQKTIVI